MRVSFALIPVVVLTALPLEASRPPLVHIQTDRPSYRLGETLWYRAHTTVSRPLSVRLLTPRGSEVDRRDFGAGEERFSGHFFLSPRLDGGTFLIEALDADRVLHRVALEVYDLILPDLDLSLSVLGETHYPGGCVTATFRARDLDGKPLRNARVEYLVTLGECRLRDHAPKTDEDGRAVVRFRIPEDAVASGHLSVGVSSRKKSAAVARPLVVSSSVSRIDAFPEGGTIVAGHPQRLGLLVRDRHGEPTGAEGRVLDDRGRCVGSFRANRWGLASTIVAYEPERTYQIAIDYPAGVGERFPLPAPTGHDHSIVVQRPEEDDKEVDQPGEILAVAIRGSRKAGGERVEVALVRAGECLARESATLQSPRPRTGAPEKISLPSASVLLRAREAEGIGHVIVTRGDRALIKRPVYLGPGQQVEVSVQPKKGQAPLTAMPLELEISATRRGQPVRADLAVSVFQGSPDGFPDVAVRSLLEPQLADAFTVPSGFFDGTCRPGERDEAFLLVYGAFRFREEGVVLGRETLPPPEAGRWLPPPAEAARLVEEDDPPENEGGVERPRARRTVVRPRKLERLLERAPFTRSARPVTRAYQVRPLVPDAALLATPGLGRERSAPPQSENVPSSRVDSRRTLFWSDRVATDARGKATLWLRMNSLVSDLSWVAQGYAGSVAVSGEGSLSTSAGFHTSFASPTHVHVGDAFDVMVAPEILDGNKEPVRIAFQVPSCLEPLLRTEIRYDPRTDARLHKFRFRVVSSDDDAELRVLARRGAYLEEHVRQFDALARNFEVSYGETGEAVGHRSYSLAIPPDAVPGSVRVHASVSPGPVGRIIEWMRRILRQPSGCFEQFTSKNYTNLAVLDALLQKGEDPVLIENAYELALVGFDRLMTHRDKKSGGFSFFPGGKPTARCTAVALRHLALYEKIFGGRGRSELEGAESWLARQDVPRLEALYTTLSLHEIGRRWKGSDSCLEMEPRTAYEHALLAACLALWPAEDSDEAEDRRRRERVLRLLDELARGEHEGSLPPGVGALGSRGGYLSVETLSLAALALHAAGYEERAETLVARVTKLQERYAGTHSTTLAIRAYARVAPSLLSAGRAFGIEFAASGVSPTHVLTVPTRDRPIQFERTLPLETPTEAEVSVRIGAEQPLSYHLRCSYRVPGPPSNPSAPYRLSQRITPSVNVNMHSDLDIRVRVEPVGAGVDSQVVARIGLPGGCVLRDDEQASTSLGDAVSYFDVRRGYVDLYWERGPKKPVEVVLPVRADIAGHFVAQPSLVYPYYETGQESHASPLELKVLNTFGSKLKLEDALDPAGRPRPPGGRTVNPRGNALRPGPSLPD